MTLATPFHRTVLFAATAGAVVLTAFVAGVVEVSAGNGDTPSLTGKAPVEGAPPAARVGMVAPAEVVAGIPAVAVATSPAWDNGPVAGGFGTGETVAGDDGFSPAGANADNCVFCDSPDHAHALAGALTGAGGEIAALTVVPATTPGAPEDMGEESGVLAEPAFGDEPHRYTLIAGSGAAKDAIFTATCFGICGNITYDDIRRKLVFTILMPPAS